MKLKELREEKKISQNKLATELKINVMTYNGWEKEKTEPNIQNLIKLADYYGVSLDYLVGRKFNDEIGYLDKADKETIQLFLTLNEINKVKVASFIAGLLAVQN